MKLSSLIVFVLFSLFDLNCTKESPTEPGASLSDTTGHAFTWQTFVLGDGNASIVSEVAIINDTLVYAVGDIEKLDSTGQYEVFNLGAWNGQNWSLQKVAGYYQSQKYYAPINSIFAFGSKDIWLDATAHWDGQQFNWIPLNIDFPSQINKMWGTTSADLFIVGNDGLIAHRDASGYWSKMTSGTNTDILDVWGISRSSVYCAVSNPFDLNEEKRILKITNATKVDTTSWLGREVVSIWTPDETHLYACGDGVFENDGNGWKEMVTGASIFTNSIRGNANNDIVVVGGFGFIAHWNGSSFRIYPPAMDVIYRSVAMKGNMIVAVGTTGAQGVVTIGKR